MARGSPLSGEAPRGESLAEPHAAGPLPSVTVALCDWPYWSVQLRLILSPGWCCARTDETSVEDLIVWPATDVITSPWASPAWAAADPFTTPATVAPLAV